MVFVNAGSQQSRPSVCLCMIVKNEALVIKRCIDSVRPIITSWIIVDTGSTDGTQHVIREHLKDLPGQLIERPWKDFAFNRSEALELARPYGDYSLIIDADDVLDLPKDFSLPALDMDSYTINIYHGPILHRRPHLVNNRLRWYYRGVLHEFVTTDDAHSQGHLDIAMRINSDGARRRDTQTYHYDAELLERALMTETDWFMRTRYTFYLAQSYRDCGEAEKALNTYLKRTIMGGWSEEIYISFYEAARLKELLKFPLEDILATYQAATNINPNRIEAIYGASRLCRINGWHLQGYQLAKGAIDKTPPIGALFSQLWMYETGLLDEFSINAYWSGQSEEALEACLKLIESGKLSQNDIPRVVLNARFSSKKIIESVKPPKLGSVGERLFVNEHKPDSAPPRTDLETYPRILVAILAKQKERSLPLYLQCIESLDYPKSSIVLYIRTNNNRDNTESILRNWVARVGQDYAAVEFDATDVEEKVENFGVHEWNAIRFKVLGNIRNESLQKTFQHNCEFYFVCDVDNFIRPFTLTELVNLNLSIVSPLLRAVSANDPYSNYHADIDAGGYYRECDQYFWILNRWVTGIFDLPVVHCTYLIRRDVIEKLTYVDETDRYEYVIFSDSARKAKVPQYFDNRKIYGYIAFDRDVKDGDQPSFDIARDMLINELPKNSDMFL